MRKVEAAGFPVPRVLDVSENELVMERIEGPTMFQDMAAHPERVGRHAALLADLHERLHQLGLVHRDLHPFNVILGSHGAIVIDWEAAREGDAAVDLAETWVLLATADGLSEREPIAEHFLTAFLRHVDRGAARAALPAVIARRRGDPHMTAAELNRMDALLLAEGLL